MLRPYQIELKTNIYEAWNDGYKNVLAVMPTGTGKCLGIDTLVLMFNGDVKKVQDLKVGDLLMGPDSKPRTILSTCKGYSELFEITPVKGDPWTCNDVHMLSLVHSQTGRIGEIPLNEYLKQSNNFKHLYKQYRTGVKFKTRSTITDPYMIGLYLAEGSWRDPQITNPDDEVFEYIKKWCAENDTNFKVYEKDNHREITFTSVKRGWRQNKMRDIARYCTSQTDRWIPRKHLINDRETRLKLLAGLLDGDGHLSNGCFEITTKYDSLNRDILFLCRSLGLAAYSTLKKATIKSLNFEGWYHRISISGDTNEIPTIVPHKKASPRKQIKNVLRTGFSVKSLGLGDYYGFELDGDHRFLLGDFTVTHNTRTFCDIATEQAHTFGLPTAIEVHRKELVQQIALTLAELEIPHNIIAPRPTILGITAAERKVFGKQFYEYRAPISIVSVDTLNARINKHEKWAKSIGFWIVDEAAHVLKKNKWGRSLDYFPNAKGLGVTATPQRLDKRGLGRHADGVFDKMVQGPTTKWAIDKGFLSKYKVVVPQGDYQDHLKSASEGHDFTRKAMAQASEKSKIVGDVVNNYEIFANGKQAIVFADSIAAGRRMEKEFCDRSVPAKLLTGETNDSERLQGLIDFRNKDVKVLINVDLFDEGLDVPGIECVIMARPTMSIGKFLQMIGRGLRPLPGKDFTIIIDHVGNIKEHGLPDNHRWWTLDRIIKRRDKVNLIRFCKNPICASPYDRLLHICPYCGFEDQPPSPSEGGGRVPLELVDGDLVLLDPETLRQLEANSHLEDPATVGQRVSGAMGGAIGVKAMEQQRERIAVQKQLSELIAKWAGRMRYQGYGDRKIHKHFYVHYGMTITQALSQKKVEMIKTMESLKYEI